MGVPAIQGDLDTPHACFDQTHRRQTTAPKRGIAVSLAFSGRHLADIEGLELVRSHQSARLAHGGLVQRFQIQVGSPTAGEGVLDHGQSFESALKSTARHGGANIRHRLIRIPDLKGIVFRSKESPASRPLIWQNGHVRRDFNLGIGQFVANDRADGWMDQRGIGAVAGFNIVKGPLVIALQTDHGSNQRDILHHAGRLLHGGSKVYALDGRGNGSQPAGNF